MSDYEKTEEPTDKRLAEAHSKGQFARAEELNVVFILIAVFTLFLFTIKDKALSIAEYTKLIWANIMEFDFTINQISFFLQNFIQFSTGIALSFLVACVVAVIFSGGIQSGFRLAPKALDLKWSKLDPIEGFKRLFSARKLVEVFIDSLKLLAITWIIYDAFYEIRKDPVFYTQIPLERVPEIFLRIILLFLSRLIFILGFITLIKYLYEYKKSREDLRMTREELKEEHKQSMGNPEIKRGQKRLAKQLMQKQMLDHIQIADVVITNPTHYAVALKYEKGRDKAPIVLAKGENMFAQRIKQIARFHSVPMVENRLAARILFKIGFIGKPIPVEVYEIVAEILAFVYRTNRYYFYTLKRKRIEFANKKQQNN